MKRTKTDFIVVHCTATKEGVNITAKDVDRWHKVRGFAKIGYHFLIKLDGTVEIGRELGEVGAHVSGLNSVSVGVCYVGGLDRKTAEPKDTRTEAQKKSLLVTLMMLKEMFPNAKIVGHNKFANKACPCFDAEKEYKNL